MPRWMALDDIKFSVVPDEQCTTLPPEADPSAPSTSTSTTRAPFRGKYITINFHNIWFRVKVI